MTARFRSMLAVSLVALATGVVAPRGAWAETPPGDKARAGAAFEEGVGLFQKAQFAEAARAFLRADEIAPSAVALTNAINAGKRAGDYLLVARAAQRAIDRGELEVQAREVLAEAATRLARLDLRCEEPSCQLWIDGEPIAAGRHYLLPGRHALRAIAGARVADEGLSAGAGDTYEVHLLAREGKKPGGDPAPIPPKKGLPRAVFFTGIGMTAVLTGITIWSGADALSAKNALPAHPFQSQNDDVLSRAHRTDGLLAGAVVLAAGTAVVGVFFTQWSSSPALPAATVTPVTGGAVATLAGRF